MPTSNFSGLSKGSKEGFTLFEILIVISIITVLSSLILGYSQRNSRQLALASSHAKLSSLVSRAKFLSIQTYFDRQGNDVICGHGVKVADDYKSVFIFQDINDSGQPCSENIADYEYESNRDKKLSGELNEIYFSDDSFVNIDEDQTNLDYVIFVPPEPLVKINGGLGQTSGDVVISDGDLDLKVTVTDNGQIKLR